MKAYKSWNVRRETDKRAVKLMHPRESIDDFVNRLMEVCEQAEFTREMKGQ